MLDLKKGKEELKLSLEKKGITTVPSADLAFILDVSGSFDDEHREGITQTLLERLVPWGMLFDPDQKLDVFTFASNDHYVGEITPETTDRYIEREIIRKVPGYGSGTRYGNVLERALKHFGWGDQAQPGFFGKLMGAKPNEKKRSIVLFITDGANEDEAFTSQILNASEQRKDEVYFLFIGIGNGFSFLQKVADNYGNTGLVVIRDLRSFVAKSNDELNDELIGPELITWLKK